MAIDVSIIIPVYNSEDNVLNCLKTCIEQSYKNIEIIVINDGSTDRTKTIIESFSVQDNRIRLINKINEGVNLARQKGINEANGKYLFFLDADDTIPVHTIHRLINASENYSADIVCGDVLIYKNNKVLKSRDYSTFKEYNSSSGQAFLEFILKNKLHYLWGKLIKKNLYVDNPIMFQKDLKIGEDQIQMYQLCMFAKKVTVTKETVYHYILNEFSVTQRKTPPKIFTKNWEAYALALEKLLNTFNFSPFVKQQLNLRILWALFGAIGTSKQFVYNKKASSSLLRITVYNAIFSKKTLLFSQYKLLFKSIVYPIIYRLNKNNKQYSS